jgi:regulator of protease activity HflC (stomatin/prohibitin superfamily)
MVKLPFIEKVVKMDTRVQKEEVQSSAATKDMQDVNSTLALNYSISKEAALEIYNNLGTDYKDNIIVPALHESFKAGTAKYTAEELITHRTEVKEIILAEIKERLSVYGITITDLNIVNLDFSQAFNQAIEAKAIAQQNVEQAKQELERAKIDAEKKKTEAEAEAAAQRAQQETLTELMVKKMWIEKWNGQLPSTMTDDASVVMGMSN